MMDALQLELCALVTPGRDYADIQFAAHRGIGRILSDAGLVRVNAEDAVASGLTAVFYPHGVGHLLGLQVHDVGGHLESERGGIRKPPPGQPHLRLTRRLEADFVVTIEPGLYFIPLLLDAARAQASGRDIAWDAVDALRPFGGIRIEDNVVARHSTPLNLTREAFAGS